VNFLDLIFLILIGWSGWNGFKKGFIIEVFGFLALFTGLYAGILFSDFLTRIIIEDFGSDSEYVPIVAFAIIFLAVGAMVYFAGKTLERVIKIVRLSTVNKLAGLLLGVAKMAFFVGAGLILAESYDERTDIISDERKEGSLLYHPLKNMTRTCIPAFDESTLLLKNSLEVIEGKLAK
jgi:membrane protein required for colicin V production